MKKITLFLLAIFMSAGMFAQTTLFEDDMESYPLNSYLAVENPTWYTTWSNNPGSAEDALVKDVFSHSPTKSACVDKLTASQMTDLILKLGDKVSGAYDLIWWMYIESGKCGYYNIQHTESPGVEWAFEVYFRANGTIEMQVGGQTINGAYTQGAWFEVKHEIDIDADNCKLYFDGVLFHEWPFSYQASSTTGMNQLGGVDFFAGEAQGSGEDPIYYFDDVEYIETTSGANPIINVTPDVLEKWVVGGTTANDVVTVSNTGTADLTWNINLIYDVDQIKSNPAGLKPTSQFMVKTSTASSTLTNGGAAPANDATGILHYDGDNANAIGWGSVPVTVTVAARFTNDMTLPYAGLDVVSVDVYINDQNTTGSNEMFIKIYGMGNDYEPGALLYEQSFTPTIGGWETIVLTTPVPVTGEDLWVGYQFTQHDAGIYIPGVDAGPNDPNGDFLSTGVGWTHLSSNPALTYNWNIRANLEGEFIEQWLSANPMSGTVVPSGNMPVDVTYDATNLTLGTYNATMLFLSNDPDTPQLDVPVTLHVVGVGIDDPNKTSVMIYPNPATDRINILTSSAISSVVITDFSGKTVYSGTASVVDISAFANGVYFVRTVTGSGTSNMKFIKK